MALGYLVGLWLLVGSVLDPTWRSRTSKRDPQSRGLQLLKKQCCWRASFSSPATSLRIALHVQITLLYNTGHVRFVSLSCSLSLHRGRLSISYIRYYIGGIGTDTDNSLDNSAGCRWLEISV